MNNHELQLSIVPATLDDVPELVQVLQDASDTKQEHGDNIWGTTPFTNEEVQNMVDGGHTYVAKTEDGTIAGTFVLQPEDERMWGSKGLDEQALYIHRLSARREFKGKGVGEQIISWVGQKARELQKPLLRLDCPYEQRSLCEYYERRGFYEVERRDIVASPKRRNPNAHIYKAALYELPIQ
jgi:GNAT superfamily N-acetyltransferase